MRRAPFIAANACVIVGLGIIGYAIFGPSNPDPADLTSCPEGMALTTGASGHAVCIRGVTLAADSDLKCPEGHVAMEGVGGRTICTPGLEISANKPG